MHRYPKFIFSGLMMLFFINCHSKATAIVLAAQGKSSFSVVIPENFNVKEKKAATVFTSYFLQVTGIALPVVTENRFSGENGIYIGHTKKSTVFTGEKIVGEGFLIAQKKNDLFLRGGSGQGIIYAAYTFIEKYLGCRKYDSGPAFCAKQQKIILPDALYDLENPAFVYRQTYYPPSADAEYLQWHKLHQFEDLWGVWGHSFFKIIDPEKCFAPHPEYFAEVNGKRTATQLCLSNPEVLKLTVNYFRKAISKNPDAIYWSVSQNDGSGYCTCQQCRKTDEAAGSPQGSILKFVNQVAANFPEQEFTTLAYGYSRHPPKNINPAKNVIIMLSSIDAERQQPLQKAASAAHFRQDLQGWKSIAPQIFVWDYTTQFTNYLCPFPDYQNLQPNLNYLKSQQVSGIFSQGSGETYGDLAELNSYIQAKALWDPDINSAKIIHEFCNGYYGAAGNYIEKYISLLQQNVISTHAKLDIYGNPVNNVKDYLSAEAMNDYNDLFDQAETAVKNNDAVFNRVKRARLPLIYTILQQSKLFPEGAAGYLTNRDGRLQVKKEWIKTVSAFVAECKLAGVKELSENGIDPENYLQEWTAILSDEPTINLAKNAKVVLENPFSEDYPANKEETLTDGVTGNLDYSYNWLFMYGKDLVATIDMGTEKQFSSVRMNFLNDPVHHIYPPKAIEISVSADGKAYQPLVQKIYPQQLPDSKPAIIREILNAKAQGRFIRVKAVCLKELPAWQPESTKKPALCCDEVFVK